MNNEDFYSADFTNSLPPALKNDPDMMALAQTISAQLQTTAAEVRKNIIYARIVYGADLPADLAASMAALIEKAGGDA